MNTKHKINDEIYLESTLPPQKGDVIYDKVDGNYGIVESVYGQRISVKTAPAVEEGIPMSRVVKLTKLIS